MTKFNELEKKIKNFKEDIDYKVISTSDKKTFLIISEELKRAVSPFSLGESKTDDFVLMSRKKVEKDSVTGKIFTYEENVNGSKSDKVTIMRIDNLELDADKRVKEIDQIDERMSEIDRRVKRIDERMSEIDNVPTNSGNIFSFTRRKFNEKGEVVNEEKKIDFQKDSPSSSKIEEITNEEAKALETQQSGNGKAGSGSTFLWGSGVILSLIGLALTR